MSSSEQLSLKCVDKHTTDKKAVSSQANNKVEDLSRLFRKMNLTPRIMQKKKRPLGVACGKKYLTLGGTKRKILINVKNQSVYSHKLHDKISYCPSKAYLPSQFCGRRKSLRLPLSRKKKETSQSEVETDAGSEDSQNCHIAKFFLKSEESANQTTTTNVQSELNCASSLDVPGGTRPPSLLPTKINATETKTKGIPTRRSSRRNQSSCRKTIEFTTYLNKRVIIRIAGRCLVEGTVRGYDSFQNLVLEDAVEHRGKDQRFPIGAAVIRGRSIAMIEEAWTGLSPDIFCYSKKYYERKPMKTIQLDD